MPRGGPCWRGRSWHPPFPEIGRDELFRFFPLAPAEVAFVDPGRSRGPGGPARSGRGPVHVAVAGFRARQGVSTLELKELARREDRDPAATHWNFDRAVTMPTRPPAANRHRTTCVVSSPRRVGVLTEVQR
ncbi:hypothetical protein LWC34_26660 [Kibdelosporangium philippinense]|uniref:Uncharacterized protein n=1 Tax=Kibdelosporangium philippinense TaxID=211113 RepID=A0ABS8ZH59_9PSEU|nr:hypothetical protein [Kibdelosporangium philippinense]MCE7006388.1 hypothetical protein [Kibdelosporangium philippinense]